MISQIHQLLESGGFKRQDGLENIAGDFPIDEAIVQLLSTSFQLTTADLYGKSDFSITGCLWGIDANGAEKKYFVKCAMGDEGGMMLKGDYTSLTTIQDACPGLVPSVIGYGSYTSPPLGSDIHSFIEDFLNISKNMPSPDRLALRLAEMHREGKSLNGKFGFPLVTCDGPLPHPVAWQSDWPTFFTELLRSRVRMDAEACGPWPKLELAAEQVVTKVVPRLLGSLEWRGSSIEPSLIHGDLWGTNVDTLDSGEPVIYDAGCYYAHNEMEIGIWRVVFAQKLGAPAYRDAYLKQYPPAEPTREWDDRNRLYSLKCNLNWSATDPGIITRKIAYNDMCFLCEKYAPLDTIDKYDPSLDPVVTPGIVPPVV
ncbi:Fructosamine kinase-domain-containing protein [Astrocystis sublimbata]|nr:Fructosamine kinase-domain-containing protein [Astrocystis sublimbata]